MRILMLAQFYPPILGGEERHVKSLCDALVARGHEVAVATFWHPGLEEFELDGSIRVYRIRSSTHRARFLFSDRERNHAPPFPDPESVMKLRQVVAIERPQIVHAHNWLVYSFLPLKRWSRTRLVMTLHDFSLACVKKRMMYNGSPCSGPELLKCLGCASEHYGRLKGLGTVAGNRVMRAFQRGAVDLFLAVSQATADGNRLETYGVPYRVIPNFVPDNIFDEEPYSGPLLEELPKPGYLLFVGDLTREKGIHVLLDAYRRLKNAPDLVMIGRKIADTPVDLPPNVHLLGSWPHPAVMQAWQRSSIALAPSIWPEPFGIVAIEAMASGKPVIASRTGGLTDIVVDGETGLLVQPGDAAALQHALERLISDPQLRDRMGKAGKHRVRMFQADVVVPEIEAAYLELTEVDRDLRLSVNDRALIQ